MHRQRGIAAIEFGLTFFLIFGLLAGIVEFGRAMNQYDTLAKSARSAARYLAVYDAADPVRQLEARNLALCRNASGCSSTTAVAPGLTLAMISVAEPTTTPGLQTISTGVGTFDIVTVTIGAGTPYPFRSLFGTMFNIQFSPISVAMPQAFG
jgi:Flp pilus assembly protein TadG